MRVRAFAKINLSLRVLGARADGYHELRTIVQSIALHDTLAIRRARGPLRLACDDPRLPIDGRNLVVRAADAVWKASGRRGAARDVAIDLVKRIPIAAGLGGGSSDAAAAVRALGRLWNVDEPRQRAIAASLGADVPYFFEGGTVLGLDRGDLLFPLIDYPSAWVALVAPPFGVSTQEAYAWFDHDVARPFQGRDRRPERPAPQRANDLQAPVGRRHPEIARLVSVLRRAGAAQAAMSGSGSAVFGLFGARSAAVRAIAAVPARAGRAILTRTIARSEYGRLAAN